MKRLLSIFATLLVALSVSANPLILLSGSPPTTSGPFTSSTVAGLKLWLKADSGLQKDDGSGGYTAVTSDGDAVKRWLDQSGGSNNATQSSSSARPLYKTAIVATQPAVLFDGTDDFLDLTGMTQASGSVTVFFVFSTLDTDHYLFDDQTGRLVMTDRGGPSHSPSFYAEESWQNDFASWMTGWQVMEFVLDGSSTTGVIYRNGSALGTPQLYHSKAIGGSVALGSYYAGSDQFTNGYIAEVLIYTSALNSTDRGTVRSYLMTKYGL